MELDEIKRQNLILLECISGSRAYDLATPDSDTDIRGIFIMPKEKYYGLNYFPQISSETNDVVFYELKRFMELLSKNNPSILELLAAPEDVVVSIHPLVKRLKPEFFLSKLCKNTFAGYAMTQVKKAKGLNKKIVSPVEKERKDVLDFCYVVHGQGSLPVKEWIDRNGMKQENCGLSKIPHMHDAYGIYYDENAGYKGIIQKHWANEVSLSSIPKGTKPVGIMSFNRSGYSRYCKEYQEYWQWVKDRNEARYANTLAHGKNYDSKNMMHTFRLLNMAEEIGREGRIIVRRHDRDFLLAIKNGEYEYEKLVEMALEKIETIEGIYTASSLPEVPDLEMIERLLIEIREEVYAL